MGSSNMEIKGYGKTKTYDAEHSRNPEGLSKGTRLESEDKGIENTTHVSHGAYNTSLVISQVSSRVGTIANMEHFYDSP